MSVKVGVKIPPETVNVTSSGKTMPHRMHTTLKCGIVLNLDIPHEIEKGGIRIHSLPAYLSDEISRLTCQ